MYYTFIPLNTYFIFDYKNAQSNLTYEITNLT